jgi:hypothetical protein
MPKNKLSAKYMANVKLYRGPTHDLPFLPQFAPDNNLYEGLPHANFPKLIMESPDMKVSYES